MRIATAVLITVLPISVVAAPPVGQPTASKRSEIPVTLFQHPCALSGPFSEKVLQLIHSISPEKLPPTLLGSQAKPAADKLRAATDLPAALETYRSRLIERLEAKVAFEDGWAAAKKAQSIELLLAAVVPRLKERAGGDFAVKARKLDAAKDSSPKWGPAHTDQLLSAFEEALGAHPEEEFHRAIERLQVRYACNYGEAEPGS